MKLSWLFGSSMAAHHLLYSYLSVWLMQGGYCAWIAWKWFGARRNSQAVIPPPTNSPRDL